MDAQGRSPVDPADQWVYDPATGSYELRLQPDEPPTVPAGKRADSPTTQLPQQSGRRRETATPPAAGGRRSASHGRATGGQNQNRRGGPPPSRRKAKPKKSSRKKATLWTAGSAGLLLVAASVGGYLVYQHFNSNIKTISTPGIGSSSVTTDGPVNILVIGTDSRQGLDDGEYGDTTNVGHADTTLLFHVSKDRTNATVLSIPRDLITDIPDCPTMQPNGSVKDIPGSSDVRFNTSLGQDGRDPGCVMRTVKELTGITPDHFIMANFDAVKDLSTAVGGVDVCLAKTIDDPGSHLKLSAGRHVVKGEQALAFVRTRHSVGFGGDLSRIELQQQFLSSMIRKMKSSNTLTSPSKLLSLADTTTKALTVDSGIGSVKKLVTLAQDLSTINTKNITFVTVPVKDNPAEKTPTTVVLEQTKAPQLFAMVRQDVSLTKVKKQKAPSASGAAKLEGPRADAINVRVEVFNGSGQFGAAQSLVEWLQNNEGVSRSTNGGNAPAPVAKTTLDYAPNQADQARRLADMMGLPALALHEGTKDAAFRANMKLTLGKDFTTPGTPIAAPATAPSGIERVEASDKNLCAK